MFEKNHTYLEGEFNIAIIGGGPRGVYAFERLSTILKEDTDVCRNIVIHCIDPSGFGSGAVYYTEQPDYMLLNTVSSQVSAYADKSVINAGPIINGRNLHEWLNLQGIDIGPNEYPTRAQHGEYLRSAFHEIAQSLPNHIGYNIHTTPVTDIVKSGNKRILTLEGRDTKIKADYVLLTAYKHTANSPIINSFDTQITDLPEHKRKNIKLFHSAYPAEKNIKKINKNDTVGILGLGLSAIDAILSLTIGMGGNFITSDSGKVTYKPSGNEPKIVAWSRNGLPLTGRGINQKGIGGQYKAKFLTIDKIDQLKLKNPHNKLDFENDILPEIIKDMSYVYYTAQQGEEFANKYIEYIEKGLSTENLLTSIPKEEQFDWETISNPLHGKYFESKNDFKIWIEEYLQNDYNDCCGGNVNNPRKAACDVLRDIRDNIRYAVEFGGLTPQSHKYLDSQFVPINNFLAVGPPFYRNVQILALINSGILDISFGSSPELTFDKNKGLFSLNPTNWKDEPTYFNVLIDSRIGKTDVVNSSDPLINNLLHRGIARPFVNQFENDFHIPGGIEIDRENYLIDKSGNADQQITCMGLLTEGCRWYTFVAARPEVNSRSFSDAGKWALNIKDQLVKSIKFAKTYS